MDILILASLIVLNGLFAMSEVALLTARRPRLATRANQGDGLASAAMALVEHPTRFLSTIQIGITSIGLLNGIFGEALLAGPLAEWLQSLGLERKAASIVATSGVVIGITAANNPREVRAGTVLIKARARPDPAALADPTVPLQSLR